LEQETRYRDEASQNKIGVFLSRFPEYRKTLRLAVVHEESSGEPPTYQGWQWHNVETHPTKLIRLVTEGITRISLRTRHATYYVLRDRETVKRSLGNAVGSFDIHTRPVIK
jgi:hypothetical protein